MNRKERLVLEVIIKFASKANELINVLATKFDLDLSKEDPFGKLISRQNNLWKGSLPNNWNYQFHGSHCKFENEITNQILDVTINRGSNYGIFQDSTLYCLLKLLKNYIMFMKKSKSEKF